MTIESYAIEEALYHGESSQLVYDHETHIKSFESYQKKLKEKIKKATKKINKGLQDALKSKFIKKKKSSKLDSSVEDVLSGDDQSQKNLLLNNL